MSHLLNQKDFQLFISKKIQNIDTNLSETKAYINGIFNSYINSAGDLSKQSLTLEYIKAKENYDFSSFQNIGDWIFFVRTMYPESVTSDEYYDTLAQCSYYKCYIIIDKKWPCFEELADRFEYFVNYLKCPS